jgi:hypothetical protein
MTKKKTKKKTTKTTTKTTHTVNLKPVHDKISAHIKKLQATGSDTVHVQRTLKKLQRAQKLVADMCAGGVMVISVPLA